MSRVRKLAPGHRSEDTSARPGRRANNPVLALQQAVGNRAVGRMLARKPSKNPTIQIGKLTIQVAGGNIAAWAAGGEVPEALEVTSEKGRHSTELERLSKERTRIKSLTLTVAAANKSAGQELDMGSLAIEIVNARIKGYGVDGKTESWRVADFDRVNRTKTTRKVS
jgi:hypothetical protein